MRTLLFIAANAFAVSASSGSAPVAGTDPAAPSLSELVAAEKEKLKAFYKPDPAAAPAVTDTAGLGDKLFKEVEESLKKMKQAEEQIKADKKNLSRVKNAMIANGAQWRADVHEADKRAVVIANYELIAELLHKATESALKSLKQYETERDKVSKKIPADKQSAVFGGFSVDKEEGILGKLIYEASDSHKGLKTAIRSDMREVIANISHEEKKLEAEVKALDEKLKAADEKQKAAIKAEHKAAQKKLEDQRQANKARMEGLRHVEDIAVQNRKAVKKISPKLSIASQIDSHRGKSSKVWLIVVASVVAVLVIAAAVYFFVIKKH